MRIAAIDFSTSPLDVAEQLIGTILHVGNSAGLIVETEAYDHDDPASHSFKGKTPRNAAMFGAPGSIYVYRSYGIHWCFNIVCREIGTGAAVLIRALEPLQGIEDMQKRRRTEKLKHLCAGPGRLGEALAIGPQHNGLRIDQPPFRLEARQKTVHILSETRIGIRKAADWRWRFCLKNSPFLSRPHAKSQTDKV